MLKKIFLILFLTSTAAANVEISDGRIELFSPDGTKKAQIYRDNEDTYWSWSEGILYFKTGDISFDTADKMYWDDVNDVLITPYMISDLTEGSVVFIDANGGFTEDNTNFYFDDGNDILTALNLTAGEIVQAEQLTSTDDITMQGHLFTGGSTGSADDTVFSFLGSVNTGSIEYDQSEDDFLFPDANVRFTHQITARTLTDGTVVIASGDISGAVTINQENAILSDSLLFTSPTESDVKFGGLGKTSLYIEGQTLDKALYVDLFTKRGDGGDSVGFQIFGKGTVASQVNTERLSLSWSEDAEQYLIGSTAAGTGTVRELEIYTGANADQILLKTDGDVVMTGGLDVGDDVNGVDGTFSGIGTVKRLAIEETGDATSTPFTVKNEDLTLLDRELKGLGIKLEHGSGRPEIVGIRYDNDIDQFLQFRGSWTPGGDYGELFFLAKKTMWANNKEISLQSADVGASVPMMRITTGNIAELGPRYAANIATKERSYPLKIFYGKENDGVAGYLKIYSKHSVDGDELQLDVDDTGNFDMQSGNITTLGTGTFADANIGGAANYTSFADDGELTLNGTARVLRGIWISFNALKAPGTKPAAFKEWGISGAWEFSDGTDDTIVFNLRTPPDMDRGVAPSLLIGWSTNTPVTTETAVWQLEYLWTSAGEDTTAAAQETLTVNSNAVAQANGLVVAEITGIDLPSATDVCMHCRVKRLGVDGDDDLTDTAELHGVCLQYTSDKLGTGL